nr:hypothetical protein [Tanacetum cinerariifolium]
MMCFEAAMERQRHRQKILDNSTMQKIPRFKTKLPIERYAQKKYTKTMFTLIQEEINLAVYDCHRISESLKNGIETITIKEIREIKVNTSRKKYNFGETSVQNKRNQTKKELRFKVSTDKSDGSVLCSCMNFMRFGFLCRHIFHVLKGNGLEVIPDKYILKRWMRDLLPPHIRRKKHMFSFEGGRYMECLATVYLAVEYCLNLLAKDEEKLIEFVEKVKRLKIEVEEANPNAKQLSKREMFNLVLGVEKSELNTVKNLEPYSNKGNALWGQRKKCEIEKLREHMKKHRRLCKNDFVEMILAKFKNIHHDLRSLSEELYEGLLRFPDCVKLNKLNKKFQEDLCNKDLARKEDAEDANVANPFEAANVTQASPTAQGSCAAILHASPIRMTKKAAKQNDKVYQGRRKTISKKKKIDSLVCNVKKSSAKYTEDNSNDEDNEDSHSAEEEKNTEDSEPIRTPPVKKRGRPKKIVRANENKSSSVKRRGRPRKSNDESKKQTIGSKRKGREYKVDDNDDDDNDGTKKMNKESKISDENNKNSKIRTRTTPTALFNAMDILNGDRKKCLHEMGFGSMIGIGMHELLGKLGFYVIDNLDTKTNVISLTDNSILVTSQSVHDILEIPMGGCSLESLAPRSPDDLLIKEWFSQFGEKNEDKNDLLHSDSKMESDSPASNDDNQKSDDDDDGKQDVVMDEIDEQNKEDVCKEDVNEPIAEKINNEDQDAKETPFEFSNRKDEKTVHNVDTSKNVNEKCTAKENTNVEQAETQVETTKIINECHIDVDCSKNEKETSRMKPVNITRFKFNTSRPKIINIEDSESEKEEFDFGGETDNEEKYDPKGEFYKSPYELKPIEPKICVSASEKLVADTLVAMMYKPRKDDYEDSIDEVDPNIILKEVVRDINKSSAKYSEDNSNDEDNEDNHSAKEEQNTKDSGSLKTPPIKKCGHLKEIVRANENKSSSVKRRGHPRKSNDESKKQTIGSKRKGREYKIKDDDDNGGTKRMKKKMDHKEAKVERKRNLKNTKSKIMDESSSEFEVTTTSSNGKKHKKNIKTSNENKNNIKIHTRATPTALFNAMAILNVDRKKCLYEMGFGSMIRMEIHKLPGMLGFYVINNLDTETNVLSLSDNSILVTSQSVHDILEIPMGGCSLESLASRSPNDLFIKEWFS